MKDTSNYSLKQGTPKGRQWLPSTILFGLLGLNGILLFIPGGPPAEDVHVFCWQRYNGYLYQLQCLVLILVPIAAVIGGIFLFRQANNALHLSSLAAGILLFFVCVFVNYSSLFISRYVYLVGTVSHDRYVYHLIRYEKYDDPSEYYLGKCDRTGFWCVFHEIYDFFITNPGSPQITVDETEDLIMVKMGDDIVYTFDGQKGECTEAITLGWCVEPPP
jgi:hypothetical protein